jgi:hypothetical protein
MDISGIVIAVVASGAATALVTAVLNRRIDRANERVSGYSGSYQKADSKYPVPIRAVVGGLNKLRCITRLAQRLDVTNEV